MNFSGRHHTEESKRKMSEIKKGKKNPMYGRRHTHESREKMSKALKGKYVGENNKLFGKPAHCSFKNRKHTEASKEKISKAHIGMYHSETTKEKISKNQKGKLAGEKNPKWKGGVSKEYKNHHTERNLKELKKKILKRDNYICQECGATDITLDMHHIIPWKISHNDSLENLLTLCHSCHKKIENPNKQNHALQEVCHYTEKLY